MFAGPISMTILYVVSLRCNLMLSSTSTFVYFLLQFFQLKLCKKSCNFHACYMSCPHHSILFYHTNDIHADPSGRVVWGAFLQPRDYLDSLFESRRGHGCSSFVFVVGCVGSGLPGFDYRTTENLDPVGRSSTRTPRADPTCAVVLFTTKNVLLKDFCFSVGWVLNCLNNPHVSICISIHL